MWLCAYLWPVYLLLRGLFNTIASRRVASRAIASFDVSAAAALPDSLHFRGFSLHFPVQHLKRFRCVKCSSAVSMCLLELRVDLINPLLLAFQSG